MPSSPKNSLRNDKSVAASYKNSLIKDKNQYKRRQFYEESLLTHSKNDSGTFVHNDHKFDFDTSTTFELDTGKHRIKRADMVSHDTQMPINNLEAPNQATIGHNMEKMTKFWTNQDHHGLPHSPKNSNLNNDTISQLDTMKKPNYRTLEAFE